MRYCGPVRIVSPFAAGSGPDAVSRIVGEQLAKSLGQPVVVDPRPGGNGFIAMEAGKRAPATGHELVIGSIDQLAINPSLFRKLPYDPVRDFVPVAGLYRVAFFVPEVKAKLGTFGFAPASGPGEEVAQWMARDTKRYAGLIRRTGASVD